ncbi:nucleoside permease [Flavobacterium sp. NKUCC04_CG]|uniref:nucleoside permease n=1 Tax=Flavobacterium sp. NKUCC04_CG TaxID=2842121 RepID=UPI001C5AD5DE|nr:nucleoside permease [Flavobacterium sp. NKUCC04_CG]MBW3519632.1 nucleoside permease [Flavobacterium sp. NKUCC04_CG]
MSSKIKLTIMNFMQFFVWGAWLITIANYWFGTKHWDGTQFGLIFGTMGIASVFMPTLSGIIADRWVNAEKLYGVLHLLYAATLFYLPQIDDPTMFFNVMLLAMCFYMPTISLNNSISYSVLKSSNLDVVKDFPPIRVWGTIGFIAAMWVTNLTGNKATEYQFYIAGIGAVLLGLYGFTMPKCPPKKTVDSNASFFKLMGLDAFKLFANYKITIFFVFSMFLGGALQLTNAYGDVFLSEFEKFPKYADSFVVKHSTIVMSISQISETLFILAIPFFLKRFGIKKVMLISMFAWVLRFALFAYGDPVNGLWMIIMSCVVYGMAFDFFNISGSLFVETSTDSKMRSSAQGLFMMMTNGFGAILGSVTSGWMIDKFFTIPFKDIQSLATYLETDTANATLNSLLANNKIVVSAQGMFSQDLMLRDWQSIWLSFALYSLIIAVFFALLFKHKHVVEEAIPEIKH